MNTKIKLFQASVALLVSGILATPAQASDKIVYPIQEMSKLECRFQDFDTLSSSCKQNLPILKTKDYKKYVKKNDGYNDFTRIYTVLWWASYQYGWDQWNGGHQWVDIATAKGTPVYAMADGKVIVAKTDIGWGKVVSVEHTINGKTVVSDYAHLSKIDVKLWERVKAWEKIGEVGSTGNSTGNHLHFQIDLQAPFYPYYYDYKACPYSYYDITEKGVCFDELASHTIDPLLFLETNGAVLEKIVQTKKTSSKTTTNKKSGDIDTSIFYTYVYKESPSKNIEEVQRLYKTLWVYNGKITGNYNDIEESIINYQIDRNVIENRNSLGAGYFGPKTRAQTKLDYDSYLANGNTPTKITQSSTSTITTQKISRTGLLSREEIEKREVDEFLKNYTINIKNLSKLNEVQIGKNTKVTLEILDKRGRGYRGSTPGNITLTADNKIASVFPNTFFYFDNGKRDIYVAWVKQGTTTLTIKLGTHVLKKVTVRVGNATQVRERKSLWIKAGLLLVNNSTVIGEAKTGIVLLRDSYGTKMVNKHYDGRFAINSDHDVLYCVKKWKLKDIRTIYNRKCKDTEYQDTLVYDYDDTVWGLLIFDYKVYDRNTRLELVKIDDKKTLSAKNLTVKNPKWLSSSYSYYDEVISTLQKGVTDGVNKGYFLEDRKLTEYDAHVWIKNALVSMKEDTTDLKKRWEMSQKIFEINKNLWSSSRNITRWDLLDMATKYLVLDSNLRSPVEIDYRDMDTDDNQKANIFFNKENTWKDKFWENYFRPKTHITRWEWAYLIARAIETNQEIFLAAR